MKIVNTADTAPATTSIAPATGSRRPRHRNARGHGALLADEIVEGALAIIDRTGSAEAVTLRAVAREIGIAAPSIYAHFADRESVVMAAVVHIFEELRQAIERSIRPGNTPVGRLVDGCSGYVGYGLEHPNRYGVLFIEHGAADRQYCQEVPIGPDGRPVLAFGAESFALLVEALEACVESGASESSDVVGDSTAIWVALHGAVSLRIALGEFPWPPVESFVRHLVLSLGRVSVAADL